MGLAVSLSAFPTSSLADLSILGLSSDIAATVVMSVELFPLVVSPGRLGSAELKSNFDGGESITSIPTVPSRLAALSGLSRPTSSLAGVASKISAESPDNAADSSR